MRRSFKNLLYMTSANSILKILGIVSIVIYTRYLGKEELALVPLYALLGRLSMVIFSMGLMPNLVKDVPALLKKKRLRLIP